MVEQEHNFHNDSHEDMDKNDTLYDYIEVVDNIFVPSQEPVVSSVMEIHMPDLLHIHIGREDIDYHTHSSNVVGDTADTHVVEVDHLSGVLMETLRLLHHHPEQLAPSSSKRKHPLIASSSFHAVSSSPSKLWI